MGWEFCKWLKIETEQTPSHPVPAPRPGPARPAPLKSNFLAVIRTRLDTFASGKADAKERASLSQLLKEHPEYIGYLGQVIRGKAV